MKLRKILASLIYFLIIGLDLYFCYQDNPYYYLSYVFTLIFVLYHIFVLKLNVRLHGKENIWPYLIMFVLMYGTIYIKDNVTTAIAMRPIVNYALLTNHFVCFIRDYHKMFEEY